MADFTAMLEAVGEERKRQAEQWMTLLAWAVAHLMNATGNFQEPITVDHLLGKTKAGPDPEELKRKLEERKRRVPQRR